MAIQNFDQLNNLSQKWFDKMGVSQRAKDSRIELSMLFTEILIMFFEMIIAEKLTREQQIEWLDIRLNAVASNHIGENDVAYVNDWSRKEAENIVDVTEKHINDAPSFDVETKSDGSTKTITGIVPKQITFEEFDISMPVDEYWTSDIRGLLLGIECASAIENYYELYDAYNRGYTHKVWKTEADNRVRKTHVEVDGVDIPLQDLFIVGNSYLLFPGDISNGAEPQEIDNCRCHCEYY